MDRRDFVRLVACGAGASLLPGCGDAPEGNGSASGKRVLVVAFDGLDPRIIDSLMRAGKLPNYKRLAEQGGFQKVATSTPPHTPVAFSSIISGADPALHQIFDFIHRDPRPEGDRLAMRPFFSTADTSQAERAPLTMGDWQIPLSGSQTNLLRRGPAFWDYLIREGIDTDVYYVPSNYPTIEPDGPGRFRTIAGMGTPDLLGDYGKFTFYGPKRHGTVGGGRFVQVRMDSNHRIRTELEGPPNFLRNTGSGKNNKTPMLTTELEIARDPTERIAKISLSGSLLLLAEGEWSDWIPIEFATGFPGSTALNAVGAPTSIHGMVRLYLKQVHPDLELYVSAINIDPSNPANPISTPVDFSHELATRHGRFCTIGIPEDTKSLSHQALSEAEFLEQTGSVEEERAAQFRHALSEFKRGCLFFYFGATDLVQHMFWRDRDERHPGRVPEQAAEFHGVVADTYIKTDKLVGEALDALNPNDTLIVFSDHGFTSFRRGFNLNTWLEQSGYLRLSTKGRRKKVEKQSGVDWSRTRAYGLGMNALYVNMQGREKYGTVERKAANGLLENIREELLKVRDEDGTAVIERVDLVEEIYPGADRNLAPDMFIGYNDGYRASWDTILGDMPRTLLQDNMDRWSGTHLIAAEQVPGMLFTSRPVLVDDASISDIAPSILDLFGIDTPRQMTGKSLFTSPEKPA